MLKAFYDDNDRIVLDVEDGLYYLNAGYRDMKDWNGIEFEIQGEDIDGNPRTRTHAIAKVDQLGHIEQNSDIEIPVYEFKNGIGAHYGYFALGYFDGLDEFEPSMTEEEMARIDIFEKFNNP